MYVFKMKEKVLWKINIISAESSLVQFNNASGLVAFRSKPEYSFIIFQSKNWLLNYHSPSCCLDAVVYRKHASMPHSSVNLIMAQCMSVSYPMNRVPFNVEISLLIPQLVLDYSKYPLFSWLLKMPSINSSSGRAVMYNFCCCCLQEN